jgi:hypothetical protein
MARIKTQCLECRFQRCGPTSGEASANDLEAVCGVRAKICAFIVLEFEAHGSKKNVLKHTGVREQESRENTTVIEKQSGSEPAHGGEGELRIIRDYIQGLSLH